MNTLFNANTICTIITVVGSVITVSITYYKTKKNKIFDTYFANKTRTYENFWNFASKYCDNPSDENKSNLRCAVYCVGLYSSEKIFSEVSDLTVGLFDKSINPGNYVEKILFLMRNDLENCKNRI